MLSKMEIINIEAYNNIKDRNNKILELDYDSLLRYFKLTVFSGVVGTTAGFSKSRRLGTAGLISVMVYATYTRYKVVENNNKVTKLTMENISDKYNYIPIAEFQGKMANIPLLVDKDNNIYCDYKGEIINQYNFQSYIPRRIPFI